MRRIVLQLVRAAYGASNAWIATHIKVEGDGTGRGEEGEVADDDGPAVAGGTRRIGGRPRGGCGKATVGRESAPGR